MKKAVIVLITIAIETLVIWLTSNLLSWSFFDTLFLGGLAIFGCVWLFQLKSNRSVNESHAVTRGVNRVDTGIVKPFQFTMSPITLGLLLFLVISLGITVFVYYPYFIS